MDIFEAFFNESRFHRELEITMLRSFEQARDNSLNQNIRNVKKRKKNWDIIFETFRCNKSKNLQDEKCTICQYGFKSNQIVRNTCLNCYFHALCIDKWLVNAKIKSCPNCMKILL